ncbi:MAG: DMT family transporter [Methylococcaceae bacterium]|nr:DMT family transporter [Methylococcaceae bacterium]
MPATAVSRNSAIAAQGALLVVLAALGFSAKAILVKLAYRHGVDAVTLLALRMAFSLPFFLALAWWDARRTPPGTAEKYDGLAAVGLGLLGYYLASLLDFLGLEYISAGLERLILFLYPTLVLLISAAWSKRRISRREAAAVVLSYLGIALVVAREPLLPERNWGTGAALVFGSALAYAVYLVGSNRLIGRFGATRFTAYGMTMACTACLAQFAATHPLEAAKASAPVYGLSLAMAVFCTVLPSLLLAQGIQRIGARRAALIGSLGPVATLVLAYLVLGESMGWEQLLGSALVLAGVMMVNLK